jgi:muconolactone delta-isomerase
MKRLFMVSFELPEEFTAEFIAGIPAQRNFIDELMAEGAIQSYALAADRSYFWAIFAMDSEFEVLDLIADFPLAEYMAPSITELAFHNTQENVLSFSLN